MCTCRDARRPPRPWCTASCSSRRRSAAPGLFAVAEADAAAGRLETLGRDVSGLPGIMATRIEYGELVAEARADAIVPLMTTLRDDPRFAFEQVMDICGVDWPERAERFDVVY